jgi:hypothetical protein
VYDRISREELNLLRTIRAQLAQAQGNPEAADRALADLLAYTVRLEATLGGPLPEDLPYIVPLTQSVIVAAAGITPTSKVPFTFPRAVRVVGIKGIVREGSAPSHITISVIDENSVPLCTNGQAEASASFAMLSSRDALGFMPIYREVTQNTTWYFQCTSGDALPGSGSTSYTPEVGIFYERLTPRAA